MGDVTAAMVAQLREMTGAGMMDAKRALIESVGDLEKAADFLRKSGIIKAGKKSERATNEGRVHSYVHGTGKVGVLVEVLCETDFVARNEAFVALCNDLAMHIAASAPLYVTRVEVPMEMVVKEKEIYSGEMAGQGKPPEVMEKIIEGKLNKFFRDICLMEQPFIKDEDKTVEEFIKEKIATLGENIQVRRFSRLNLGT
ncbi:MAG: translation elongation factor Ts [Patescibacteria group bacterium]